MPLADRFDDQSPRLRHAHGCQAIHHGEGLLAQQSVDGDFKGSRGIVGYQIVNPLAQLPGGGQLLITQMPQFVQRCDMTIRPDAIETLALFAELLRQEATALGDELGELIAGWIGRKP